MRRQYKQSNPGGTITDVELLSGEFVVSIHDPKVVKWFETGKYPVESTHCVLEELCIVFPGEPFGWPLSVLLTRERRNQVKVYRSARISGPYPKL